MYLGKRCLRLAAAALHRRVGFIASAAAFIAGFAFVSMASASGSTNVSGSISTNTVWSGLEPYVLSGDVQITSGAYLTIQPGVVVLMEDGASLTVSDGALAASGTTDKPIVFTSIHDVAGSTPQPAPGNWKNLKFADGTIDSGTILSHVHVRYGHGIVIESASPAFNDLAVDDNVGAAITLDLDSSPSGRRLSASGNDLNGILVPSGSVTGDIRWGLTGIPYVVVQGTVEVGLKPYGFDPSTVQLVAGQVGHLTLNIPQIAPTGGMSIALSSNASAAQVPSSVFIAQGQHSADVSVTSVVTGDTTVEATITANVAAYGSATAAVTVLPHPPIALTPNPSNVAVGRSVTLTVAVPQESTADHDVVVTLSSSSGSATVASTATIARGTTSAPVVVTGASAGSANISAHSSGFVDATARVDVHALTMSAPATAFVAPGASSSIDIALSDEAPVGGMTIGVLNGNPTALGTPATVSVPAHATHASVAITGHLESEQPVSLVFTTTAGYQQATTAVMVQGIAVQLGTGDDIVLPPGATISLPLMLSRAAPAGGLVFSVQADVGGGHLDISPVQVTVPAGSQTSNEIVTLSGTALTQGSVLLTSTNVTGINGSNAVRVTAPVQLSITRQHQILGTGLRSPGYASEYATQISAGDFFSIPIEIDVANSDSAHVSAPTHLTLPVYPFLTSSVQLPLAGLGVTESDALLVFSVAQAGVAAPPPLAVSVVQSVLSMPVLTQARTRGLHEPRQDVVVALDVPSDDGTNQDIDHDMTPIGGTLHLSIINADNESPSSILDGIFADSTSESPIDSIALAYDQGAGGFSLGSPQAIGTYRVKASLDGVGEWISPVQTVEQAKLRFAASNADFGANGTFTIGQGLHVNLRAYVTSGCPQDPPTISISSSDAGKAATSLVTPFGCEVDFRLDGLQATPANTPVVLTASAPGLDTATLQVTVEPARVGLANLAGVRAYGPAQDTFVVAWAGDGFPVSDQDATVQLAVVDKAPANVLPTPEIVDSQGSAMTEVEIPAGTASFEARIAGPTALGTYRVSAAVAGGQTTLSDLQTIATSAVLVEPGSQVSQTPSPIAGTNVYPLGKGLVQPITFGLYTAAYNDYSYPGTPNPAGQATTVTLRSRAPDWVKFNDNGIVVDELTLTVPQGEWRFSAELVGIETTDEPIEVDLYVGDDLQPGGSMLVELLKPDLDFSMAAVRPIDDIPSSVFATLSLSYPCDGPQGSTYCPVRVEAMPGLTASLTTIADDGPLSVTGFQDADGQPTAALHFNENVSDYVYADPPVGAGTYHVHATIGSGSWDSYPVVVSEARVFMLLLDGRVGLDMQTNAALSAQIDGNPVVFGSAATSATAVCADTDVCSTGSVDVAADTTVAVIPIEGLQEGTTQLQVMFNGDLLTVPVEVARPTVAVDSDIFWYPSPQLSVDQTWAGVVTVSLTDEFAGQLPLQDFHVQLSSEPPGVLSLTEDTLTVDITGAWSPPHFSVTGIGVGTARIEAAGPNTESVLSAPITVIGN